MKKIAILDLDSIAYVIGNPNKVLDEQGKPKRTEDGKRFIYQEKTIEELCQAANITMHSILTKCGCTHYIGYMKGKKTTNFRLVVNPDYKASRNKEEPWWWKIVQEHLYMYWHAISVDDIEVDDMVNIARLNIEDSFIVAIDGDLLGLESINPHYNWKKNEWVNVIKFTAEKKFWCDMIAGQSGDNIKGIPGKGEVYFKNHVEADWLTHKGDWADLTLKEYVNHFGVYEGIQEFYKNYISLKILDTVPDHKSIRSFVFEPVEYEPVKKEEVTENLFTE